MTYQHIEDKRVFIYPLHNQEALDQDGKYAYVRFNKETRMIYLEVLCCPEIVKEAYIEVVDLNLYFKITSFISLFSPKLTEEQTSEYIRDMSNYKSYCKLSDNREEYLFPNTDTNSCSVVLKGNTVYFKVNIEPKDIPDDWQTTNEAGKPITLGTFIKEFLYNHRYCKSGT